MDTVYGQKESIMKNLSILVVDDDPVTLMLIEKKLKKQGYHTVMTAKNGKEALDLIDTQAYDVVLTDLMMPGGVDGIALLEKVKSRYQNTEVILLTAFASVDTAVDAMKKGAVDYLQKPINFDELMIRLDRIDSLNALVKNAGDLREAMDTTEKNAGKTIQDLEMTVYGLKQKLSEIKSLLSRKNVPCSERVQSVLDRLATDQTMP